MKLIKNAFIGLLVLTLTSLIIIFTISIDLKKVIVNGIIMEVIKSQVSTISYKEANKDNTEVFKYVTDNEEVNEILASDEIQELVSKYLDLTLESMISDESLDEIEIEKDMMNYIRENKEVIEQKTHTEITEEVLQETEQQINEQEISENLKEAIKETRKNLTDNQKKTIKGYTIVVSLKTKIILFILIVLNSIFIILLQKKEYKWIYSLSNSLFSAGLGIVIMSIIVSILISKMATLPILKISILLRHGFIELIIGLSVMIIYKVVKKISNKKGEKQDEIPEIPKYNEF